MRLHNSFNTPGDSFYNSPAGTIAGLTFAEEALCPPPPPLFVYMLVVGFVSQITQNRSQQGVLSRMCCERVGVLITFLTRDRSKNGKNTKRKTNISE